VIPAPARRIVPLLEAPVRRLEACHPLADAAVALLRDLDASQTHAAGAELACEGDLSAPPRFVLTGWAARVRWLSDGRRQIVGFVLPGDSIGLYVRPHPLAVMSTIALTPVRTANAVPVRRALAESGPPAGLLEALEIAAGMDEARLLDQVVRLGRLTAYERICHLLLELRDRLTEVGLVHGASFPMPLTQEVLADAAGLSIVHVNRILQQLRRQGLLDLKSGRATLLDAERIESAADYVSPRVARSA
jgi:CRP-like cAMP-binding protein